MIKNIAYACIGLLSSAIMMTSCQNSETSTQSTSDSTGTAASDTTKKPEPISQPLVSEIYTADPSAHVFDGKLYVYPSHDYEAGVPEDELGSHFAMKDYHVFSMDSVGGAVTNHGVVLDIKDVPWAGRQMWAPDAAFANGKYYLYFPAKDKQDIFRIGVATSSSPAGPFKAEPKPIEGSYSIDPAVFKDDNGTHYMYFGGIWGGQLQRWASGKYDSTVAQEPTGDTLALTAKVARMSNNMLQFAEKPRNVVILDKDGQAIKAKDHDKRFFEASWVHKYNGKYYFSYSTGDTHLINYAIGDSPYGPFTYQGVVLNEVQGWTNHHSIVEFKGKWYLFYHDVQLSGQTHLRNIKVTELKHRADGTIETIDPYKK